MRLLAWGSVVVLVVLVGCGGAVASPIGGDGGAGGGGSGVGSSSGASSTSSGGSSGGGSSSGSTGGPVPPGTACTAPPNPGASDPCAPVAGTYNGHYDKDPSSSASCPDLGDETAQVDANATSNPGPGCSATEDVASCNGTVTCVDTSNGSTTKEFVAYSTCGAFTGTIDIDTVASGGTDEHCRYTFTLTKQ